MMSRSSGTPPKQGKQRLPIVATITCPKGTYEVRVHEQGMEFIRWLKKPDVKGAP